MGLEDICMFRAVPNSTVFYPSDAVSTEKAVELAANTKVCNSLQMYSFKMCLCYILFLKCKTLLLVEVFMHAVPQLCILE